MNQFWIQYAPTIKIALIYSLFTLSGFATRPSGAVNVLPIGIGAVGGYLAAYLAEHASLGLPLTIAICVVAGAVVAVLLSYPLLRLASHWMSVATIALLIVTYVLALNLNGITGGSSGVPIIGGVGIGTIVVALVVVSWCMERMRKARLGFAMESVRAGGELAASLGIDPIAVQRIAFAQSGAIAGCAGALLANELQFIVPDTFYLNLAFMMLAALVLGGQSHWFGAIVGACAFAALQQGASRIFEHGNQLADGVALIIVMLVLPGGLFEPGRRARRIGARRARAEAAAGHEAADAAEVTDSAARLDVHERATDPIVAQTIDELVPPGEVAAIRVKQLSRSFGGVQAVNALDLTVPANSVFGLVGPNGAGKSSALALVSGMRSADAGSIEIFGTDVTRLAAHRRCREVGIARTYQEVRLFGQLTVLENIIAGEYMTRCSRAVEAVLMLPRERRERRAAEERARALMDRVGVIGRPDQYAGTLSYANQRRVEIARALASKPKMLLLDEPTAGMHVRGSRAVGELLLELKRDGLTLLVVEHNMQLLREYCDLAAVMAEGRLLAFGRPHDCLDEPSVKEAYLGRRDDAHRLESLVQLRRDTRRAARQLDGRAG